jgi:hypothetical protein
MRVCDCVLIRFMIVRHIPSWAAQPGKALGVRRATCARYPSLRTVPGITVISISICQRWLAPVAFVDPPPCLNFKLNPGRSIRGTSLLGHHVCVDLSPYMMEWFGVKFNLNQITSIHID